MTSNSQNVVNHIRKRKSDLISVLGVKSCICGFNSWQEALEFHHVNPDEKEFSISSKTTKNLDAQLREIKKCILVCSNCHKGIHGGYISIPEGYETIYDVERANELLDENNAIKHGQISICPRCGERKHKTAEYCDACRRFLDRTVERPDRDTLKSLIRSTPFTQIAIKYGVTDNAIRKWCKSEGLPTKKSEIKSLTDDQWEKI